jgi:hypothetical protein
MSEREYLLQAEDIGCVTLQLCQQQPPPVPPPPVLRRAAAGAVAASVWGRRGQ